MMQKSCASNPTNLHKLETTYCLVNLLNLNFPSVIEMAQDKIRMPMSEGGLVRYGEEAGSKYQIKPEFVIGAAVAIAVIAIVLQIIY